MKLSEMIQAAQKIFDAHGDRNVVVASYNSDEFVGVETLYHFSDEDCPGVVVVEMVDTIACCPFHDAGGSRELSCGGDTPKPAETEEES